MSIRVIGFEEREWDVGERELKTWKFKICYDTIIYEPEGRK